jgi:hypothetical protein
VLVKVAVTAGELICAAILRVPTAAAMKSKAISVIADYHSSLHPHQLLWFQQFQVVIGNASRDKK